MSFTGSRFQRRHTRVQPTRRARDTRGVTLAASFLIWFVAAFVAASVAASVAGCRGVVASTVPVASPATKDSAQVTRVSVTPPAPASPPATPRVTTLTPFPGVRVHPRTGVVELAAIVCLDAGWLEQVACSAGTREHESLLVPRAAPSQIHAALLLAGHEPGAPGRWTYENDQYAFHPPTGSKLAVRVRYRTPGGLEIETPIRSWIRDHQGRRDFPLAPWVFGGSEMVQIAEGEPERYVADLSGSVVGLVTFGDEVVGFSRVLADEAAVHAPEWEARGEAMPPPGTEVSLILGPWPDQGSLGQ
ncbi:MAG: hypothetical protein HKN62_11205 [Phycisphaerales bacterium]|nr:hypothetical protein [Phycisphaerales bacterium]